MRKLLSLLLVVAMVFGFIGTAIAAPVFPDIKGNAAESDIVKLFTLDILGGYPDGTFKPEGNITRAEFAKVVCLALGKGGSANLLKNTASQFSDVLAGQWYTGYVNVAVANGIIKGYADGTFRPNANISQAEAATMLLRTMGYNDNLPGAWPLNYIMPAADLGIIGEGFTADALATRTFVCDAVMAMLGYGRVTYNATTKTFSAPGAIPMLAALSGATWVGDAIVTAYSATNGTLTLQGVADPIKLGTNVKVATGEALADLVNKHIGYIKHTVAGVTEIIYIEVRTPVVAGRVAAIDAVNNTYTLTSGTVVKLATGCAITKNGAGATLIDLKDADATALLGADGKAYKVVAYRLDITGALVGKTTTVTNGVTERKITLMLENESQVTYTLASGTTIVRNGAAATFADLKIDDDVMLSANGTEAVYVDAYMMTKEGIVTSFSLSATNDLLSVSFADGTTLPVKSGVDFEVNVGAKMLFGLNRAGQIVSLLDITWVANTAVGKITAIGLTVSANAAGEQVTTGYITLDGNKTYNIPEYPDVVVNWDFAMSDYEDLEVGMWAQVMLDSKNQVFGIAGFKDGLLTTDWDVIDDPDYVAKGAPLTLNAVKADAATILASADDIYVTWNAADGTLTKVEAYDFESADITIIGMTVTTDGSGNTTYMVDTWEEGEFALAPGFVVMKDGKITTFDALKIGDKVSFGSSAADGYKFIYAITDTQFAWYDDMDADIEVSTWDSGFSYELADVVASIKIVINGETVADPGLCPGCHDHGDVDMSEYEPGTYVIGIIATDYAGFTATYSFSMTVGQPG